MFRRNNSYSARSPFSFPRASSVPNTIEHAAARERTGREPIRISYPRAGRGICSARVSLVLGLAASLRTLAGIRNPGMRRATMSTGEDLRRMALSLEGTVEARHFDRAAFKVARIYVTLAPDGRTANFRFTPDEQEFKCMLAPDAFAPVPNAW